MSTRKTWLAPALILTVAAALRLARLGLLELDLDENYSVVMARGSAGVLRGALNDTNPPLYLYLLKGWMVVFGVEAGPVRALSVICGLAQLAALGAWLVRLGLPRRAGLWAMGLGALAPLHVYYSQVARSYTLSWLLLTLALWSFSAAADSGRRRDWALHGACLALALYTHNLFVFVVPVFVAGAAALGLGRRAWARMGATYVVVGLAYLPWLVLTLRTVRGGSLGWIAETWTAARAPLLFLGSLEALGTGAHFPANLRLAPPPEVVRWVALAWLAVVIVGLRMGPSTAPGEGRRVIFLGLCALGPLALMLAYSLAGQPIYVVGRYDTLALPGVLGLLGLGASKLECAMRNGGCGIKKSGDGDGPQGTVPLARWAGVLLALAPMVVTGFIVGQKLRPIPPGVNLHPQGARGDLLRDYWRPGDVVVCLGLEGARVEYQMMRLRLNAEPLTFPLDTRRHPGYFLPREAVRDAGRLRRDAEAILDRVSRAGGGGGRLWVALDPYSFREAAPGSIAADYTAIARVLLRAIEGRAMKEWADPEFMARARKLGLRIYDANDLN